MKKSSKSDIIGFEDIGSKGHISAKKFFGGHLSHMEIQLHAKKLEKTSAQC